ncbi:MAG: insulinase family protein [Anaerolineales bacterium]|nr:MAG: insulinase family protein [Anaerolineales bacterium]
MSPESLPVTITRLRNGLEVRLKEIRTAPLISSWIWYRVGSRNEIPGKTGISHWVEHMQFKGTPNHPGGILDRVISRLGGVWNAFTWLDWTAYYETMPANQIDVALKLEADRMVNSIFKPKDVEAERTVIISERQGHENEPTFRLAEEVQAAAYRVNSYHHEVIGDMVDLESMSASDLYEHYRHYYVPSNAVLAVAGDFKSRAMLNQIREIFGSLPKVKPPEFQPRPEPEQQGERIIHLEGPGETSYLKLAYHVPPAAHDDFLSLAVLGSVLAGAASFNFFSGGISNKTSRLYRALVEGEIAADVQGGLAATIDPYLYTLHVTLRSDRTPEQALAILDRELDRTLETNLGKDELSKAIKQAKALFAYSSESVTNQGFWMGFSEMFADESWFETYLDRLAQVTPDRVRQVAVRYLRKSNRVLGIYRHTMESTRG